MAGIGIGVAKRKTLAELVYEAQQGKEPPKTPTIQPEMTWAAWVAQQLQKLGGDPVADLMPSPFGMAVEAGKPAVGAAREVLSSIGDAIKTRGRSLEPIKAYHGSPFDFDQFSMSKIGTGEGAQAYGHGLYFAENPKVAQTYKDTTAEALRWPSGETQYFSPYTPEGTAQTLLANMSRGRQLPMKDAYEEARIYLREEANKRGISAAQRDNARGAITTLDQWEREGVTYGTTGRMYEVQLHVGKDEFLDWDKPFAEQSKKVQEVLTKLDIKPRPGAKWEPYQVQRSGEMGPSNKAGRWIAVLRDDSGKLDAWSGQSYATREGAERIVAMRNKMAPELRDRGEFFYQQLGAKTKAEASEILNQHGIKGVQFLDQGSRHAPMSAAFKEFLDGADGDWALAVKEAKAAGLPKSLIPTRNFAVWDDTVIKIAKKYGIPLATAALVKKSLDDAQLSTPAASHLQPMAPVASHKTGGR